MDAGASALAGQSKVRACSATGKKLTIVVAAIAREMAAPLVADSRSATPNYKGTPRGGQAVLNQPDERRGLIGSVI